MQFKYKLYLTLDKAAYQIVQNKVEKQYQPAGNVYGTIIGICRLMVEDKFKIAGVPERINITFSNQAFKGSKLIKLTWISKYYYVDKCGVPHPLYTSASNFLRIAYGRKLNHLFVKVTPVV